MAEKKRIHWKKRIEKLRAEAEDRLWLESASEREKVVAETCDYLLGETKESPLKKAKR